MGDKLSYVDAETGEIVEVEVFEPACLTATILCGMCTAEDGDLLYAIRMCLEHLGGVPSILTTRTIGCNQQ